MAPLSRFLSGVFLKHDTYGTHLDGSGKTIDIDLEIRNFFAIMGVVSDIWSEKLIDKCPVHCIPVDIGCRFTPDEPDPIWVANHVIQGRYMKQIVKCHISTCCAPFKTNWCKVFPTRFIPPPVPVQFGPRGLEVIEVSEYKERLKLETKEPMSLETAKIRFATLQERLVAQISSNEAKKSQKGVPRPPPFDSYCPSMMNKLDDLVCETCGSSWPSKAAVLRHAKAHKGQKGKKGQKGQKVPENVTEPIDDLEDEFETDDSMSETEQEQPETSETMPVFNIRNYVKSIYPFEEITDEFN